MTKQEKPFPWIGKVIKWLFVIGIILMAIPFIYRIHWPWPSSVKIQSSSCLNPEENKVVTESSYVKIPAGKNISITVPPKTAYAVHPDKQVTVTLLDGTSFIDGPYGPHFKDAAEKAKVQTLLDEANYFCVATTEDTKIDITIK
ncbi:MAG: hypothetical protein V1652_04115 [bacterium]